MNTIKIPLKSGGFTVIYDYTPDFNGLNEHFFFPLGMIKKGEVVLREKKGKFVKVKEEDLLELINSEEHLK